MKEESVVSQIIAKKDIMAYTEIRIQELKEKLNLISTIQPPKARQFTKLRILGRIKELDSIRNIANNNSFKRESIRLWKEVNNSQRKKVKNNG